MFHSKVLAMAGKYLDRDLYKEITYGTLEHRWPETRGWDTGLEIEPDRQKMSITHKRRNTIHVEPLMSKDYGLSLFLEVLTNAFIFFHMVHLLESLLTPNLYSCLKTYKKFTLITKILFRQYTEKCLTLFKLIHKT